MVSWWAFNLGFNSLLRLLLGPPTWLLQSVCKLPKLAGKLGQVVGLPLLLVPLQYLHEPQAQLLGGHRLGLLPFLLRRGDDLLGDRCVDLLARFGLLYGDLAGFVGHGRTSQE